jgi:hypothetical protein
MSATLLQGHPQAKRGLPRIQTPTFPDLESFMDYYMNSAGPLDPKTRTFSSGRFAGQTPEQLNAYLQTLGTQQGFPPRAQAQAPAMAPAATPTPAATSPQTAPRPVTAAAPSAAVPNTGNPGAMVGGMVDSAMKTAVAPKKPSLIDGKPAAQFFQEAANRQGRSNSSGSVQPQAPATPSAAPSSVATQAQAVENRHPALFGKVTGMSGNQAPLASAANPAPTYTMPQVSTRAPSAAPTVATAPTTPSAPVTAVRAKMPQSTNTLDRMERVANSMPRPSTDLTKMPQSTNTLDRMERVANSMPRPSTDLTKMPQSTNTLDRMERVANSMPRPSTDLTKMPKPVDPTVVQRGRVVVR